jgi:ABC-2 type transport system permease protein
MFNSIFTKSLYERRWGIMGWGASMLLATMLIMLIFPVMKDSFGTQLESVPDSLKAVLGEANDYQKISGFTELQVFAQMMFLTIIYGIILAVATLVGEEKQGVLQTLLAAPVSRTKVYWHKLLALVAILAVISLLMTTGILAGAAILKEPISIIGTLEGALMQLLVAMTLSTFAYMVGASTGSRVLAGSAAGIYAFVGYMVTTLAPIADVLEKINYASPYRYFMNTKIYENGILLNNLIPLIVACLIFSLIGWQLFIRRDIYQQ